MTTGWDKEVDVLVVGSGAGGLAAVGRHGIGLEQEIGEIIIVEPVVRAGIVEAEDVLHREFVADLPGERVGDDLQDSQGVSMPSHPGSMPQAALGRSRGGL